MAKDTLVAVDLAKSVFELAVSHHPGQVARQKRYSRQQFPLALAQLPQATVVMEACGSAHYWARRVQALGHKAVLLPPHAVRPYVRRNKTDRTDTKGMLEAYRNDEIRPVPVKSVAQQTLASLHRLRSGWLAERTARINTLRGLLREFGIVIPLGAHHAVPSAWAHIEDAESEIPDPLRPALAEICSEIRELERRVKMIERQLAALATQTPAVARLMTIPGVGLIIATALVAFVGDIQRFPSGRHFASYLGLTPRESSSGLRRRLGAISKRGDVYLRTLLIHGARAVLLAATRRAPDRLRTWALAKQSARPQQGRHRPRQQARQNHLGRLEARSALPLRASPRVAHAPRFDPLFPSSAATDQLMARTGRTGARTRREQGCASPRPCHPIGTVRAYAPHGPELTRLHSQAGDTTAVRPSSRTRPAAKETA